LNQASLLKDADVLIMHNVFQFFADEKKLETLWKFVKENARKKGCKIVAIPSIQKSLQEASVIR
jgi:hypothetical protein